MIQFELIYTGFGWEDAPLPDNHRINVTIDGQSNETHASLRDICRIYGNVLHRKEAKMIIGTGGDAILSKGRKNRVRFRIAGLRSEVSYRELEQELELLMHSLFNELDEKNDQSRNKELEYLDQWLSNHDIGFGIKNMYSEYSTSDSVR